MEITLGSELLNNYKGNFFLTASNATVVVKYEDSSIVSPGNRVLKTGVYTIDATADSGFIIDQVRINQEVIPQSGASISTSFMLEFGEDLDLIINTEYSSYSPDEFPDIDFDDFDDEDEKAPDDWFS